MLKIRLSRTGKKRQPAFRVIVQEHTASPKGKFIEAVGFYRPASENKEFKVDLERVKYWISVGAQPSDAVAVLIKQEGIEGMDKYIEPRDKKKKKKKAVEEKPAAPAAAPAETAEAPAAEEAPKEEAAPAEAEPAPTEETPAAEAAPAEEPKAEEAPAPAEEAPAEEAPAEEPKE